MIFTIQMAPFVGQSPRLVKHKRALLESNPPRNNQLETHRSNESGSGLTAAPHCLERFPHAQKNSRWQPPLHWRQAPLLVVVQTPRGPDPLGPTASGSDCRTPR